MPWNWKLPKIFFGWWIVAACILISLYLGGIIVYGFTAIFEPIASDFGWSYTQISFAASLRGLETSLLAPLAGVLVDRWGPRRLVLLGSGIIALGLLAVSRMNSLAMFYAAFVLISIGMSCCGMAVLITAVAHWFKRKIGLASGIVSCGFGLSGLMIPVIVALISRYQWRMTMVIIAVGVVVILVPLALLLRHKPEPYGFLPDGQEQDTVEINNTGIQQVAEIDITAKQALQVGAFWHVALAFLCHMITTSAVIVHVMPYLNSIGVSRSLSSFIASAIPVTSIIGRLLMGWLGDKVNKKMISASCFAMMGLGVFFFGYAATGRLWLLIPFFIIMGIGYGGSNAVRISLTRELFGRHHFGAIYGMVESSQMLGNFIGAPLAGWVFDTWGSYQGIWFILAAFTVVPIISILTIKPAPAAAKQTAALSGDLLKS